MQSLKTILIADDQAVNRAILSGIFSDKFAVLEAENGREALALLDQHADDIGALMLDVHMPVLDGYGVLDALRNDERYSNLPIIVMTENSDTESELKALTLGAWDFVSKPYNPQIILFRLKNVIARSQLSALKELKYLAEYDSLTGIYNKEKFFSATRTMLDDHPDIRFAFCRFDVDRFQLINSFFGTAEGDKLLVYIAQQMAADATKCPLSSYGRIESDIVAFCVPYDEKQVEAMVRQSKDTLAKFNPNYDIVPSIGIYVVDDPTIPVEEMYNRATLAAKTCKGNYVDFFAYYDQSMSAVLAREQEITNEMNGALKSGQFQVYLQPKYNIHTNSPCGAEALVRWLHPQKGMILPGEFIPVFERNGFISKLDYYVWEQSCKYLYSWQAQGLKPYPLSVNVSRVNIYNPQLVDTLLELLERYQLDPSLLQLELTESAYTDSPVAMKKAMTQLQSHGFVILMDDFGSGYSSLSLLKDIEIDILKIDMHFLTHTETPGRGENIIASVIRMAKWLNIPVIAEGAETAQQVDFLRSVGCDLVQGYYYARPMPVAEYEKLCINLPCAASGAVGGSGDHYCYDDLFSSNPEMKLLFNNALQAAVIYEFCDDQIELIRVNEAYYALLGHDDMLAKAAALLNMVEPEYRSTLLGAFRSCAKTHDAAECEYMRRRTGGEPLWLYTKLRYVSTVGDKHILIGELSDITIRKGIDSELQRYRTSLLSNGGDTHTVLIVDDGALNRTILKKILTDRFSFLEAGNGAEAIEVLQEHPGEIDLILLDIGMPVMDGKEFLQYKSKMPRLDGIPVVMISADDSPQQQITAFSLGANDYIVKPFIPEVVVRRVQNVLDSNHRFKELVQEYNTMAEQVKTDLMTGLINRISAEKMIERRLGAATGHCAMMMLDIDNFKMLNDTQGHSFGDKVIIAVAKTLRTSFRQCDIVARMGGDEFAVFVEDISHAPLIAQKAKKLYAQLSNIQIDGQHTKITCSAGIALSNETVNSFEALYKNADKALYDAKALGRNTILIYRTPKLQEEGERHD